LLTGQGKRIQPLCNDAVAYWSGDGGSFLVGPLGFHKGAPTYVLSLPAGKGIPELPSKGLFNITEFAKLEQVRTIPQTSIGIGRAPDTYAFVKRDSPTRPLPHSPALNGCSA